MPKTRSMRSRSRSRGRMGGRTKTRSSRAGKRRSMSLRKMRGGGLVGITNTTFKPGFWCGTFGGAECQSQ